MGGGLKVLNSACREERDCHTVFINQILGVCFGFGCWLKHDVMLCPVGFALLCMGDGLENVLAKN